MEKLIEQIVFKVIAEGLILENYSEEKCLEICAECVGIGQIKWAFENHKKEIKERYILEIKLLNKLF